MKYGKRKLETAVKQALRWGRSYTAQELADKVDTTEAAIRQCAAWRQRKPKQENQMEDNGTIRKFESGAMRDTAEGKLDYEAFLSPLVLKRYAEYLNKHRLQSDGTLRDGDNWQKGMSPEVYMKSRVRHLIDTWLIHRGFSSHATADDIEDALCAEIFNSMGMLFEVLKNKEAAK